MSNETNGMFVRRQELTCTQTELDTYGHKVILGKGEVCYIEQSDGRYAVVIGDGQTPLKSLKAIVNYSEIANLLNTEKTAVTDLKNEAEAARDTSVAIKTELVSAATEARALAISDTSSGRLASTELSSNCGIRGLTIYGQSVQNGTPTPSTPTGIQCLGDDGKIDVDIRGNNLLNLSDSTGGTNSGLTVTPNGDGSFSVVGTATTTGVAVWFWGAYSNNAPTLITLEAGEYTLTDCVLFSGTKRITGTSVTYGRHTTFTLTERTNITGVRVLDPAVGTYTDMTIYPQLEKGSVASEFEKYKGNSVSISITNPLRAVPASEHGNLVINGLSYIADTLTVNADGTGQIVRRCNSFTVNADDIEFVPSEGYAAVTKEDMLFSTSGRVPCLSNRFAYSSSSTKTNGLIFAYEYHIRLYLFANKTDAVQFFTNDPTEIIYPLQTPTTEQLTAEQVQAVLALHTYKPISTIHSDGAYIDVNYVADTKNYIDNKFNALTNAILAQGGNL